MAKEKKVENRELVYEFIASAIMQNSGNIDTIRKHKEGLEYGMNGETFIVRVVKKKTELEEADFRGEYFHDEKANAFGFKSYE